MSSPTENQPEQKVEEAESSHVCQSNCLGLEKYQNALALLFPGGNGRVYRETLLEFFEMMLGPLYNREMGMCLITIMKPDEEGYVSIENFVEAFSLACWSPESIAAMHSVLDSNPDIISKLADWKSVLSKLGLNMDDDEVAKIVEQAQKGASEVLDSELARVKADIKDEEEVIKRSSEILSAIRDKIKFLEITCAKCGGEGESEVEKETEVDKKVEETSPEPKIGDTETAPKDVPAEPTGVETVNSSSLDLSEK